MFKLIFLSLSSTICFISLNVISFAKSNPFILLFFANDKKYLFVIVVSVVYINFKLILCSFTKLTIAKSLKYKPSISIFSNSFKSSIKSLISDWKINLFIVTKICLLDIFF